MCPSFPALSASIACRTTSLSLYPSPPTLLRDTQAAARVICKSGRVNCLWAELIYYKLMQAQAGTKAGPVCV